MRDPSCASVPRALAARRQLPRQRKCQQRVSVLPPPNSETESRTRRRADLALLAPTVPFQGGVCSRNNNGARGSPGRLPHHPPHALLNHIVPVRELTDELYDELVGPADTLLARASRCVVTHIARFHDDSVVPSSNARTLGHLPADLSQRVFDELVATRQLTAALVPDFAGCHLRAANMTRVADIVTDATLQALCDVARESLLMMSLARCTLLTPAGISRLATCTRLTRLDLGECPGVDDDALVAASAMPDLVELSLAGCERVTAAGLRHLAALARLRELSLERCNNLRRNGDESEGLARLAEARALEVLNVGWCNDVRSEDIVALAGLRKLRVLNLARTMVDDRAAETLGSFERLESLNLAGCRVSNGALSALTGLSSLRELSVEFCRVSDQGIAHLAGLTSLTHLNAGFTSVSDAGVRALGPLRQMRWVSFDSCRVGDSAMRAFELWENLESANLSDTAVGNDGIARLAKLGKLAHLNLGYSNVDDYGVQHLRDMTSLRSLSLDSRLVTDEGLRYLSNLAELEELDLFGASITDAGLEALKHMPRLRSLEICGGDVTDTGVKLVSDACKNLKVLNLGQNFDITDVGVGALAELTNLTHINLAHTNITDDGLMKLTALKNLTSVAIKGCRYVSKSGVESLQHEMPRIREVAWVDPHLRVTSMGVAF